VAAYTLGIDVDLVTVKPSNNIITPNNTVTGGSMASESCGYVRSQFNSPPTLRKKRRRRMADATRTELINKIIRRLRSA